MKLVLVAESHIELRNYRRCVGVDAGVGGDTNRCEDDGEAVKAWDEKPEVLKNETVLLTMEAMTSAVAAGTRNSQLRPLSRCASYLVLVSRLRIN